jgi:hypothetical protein
LFTGPGWRTKGSKSRSENSSGMRSSMQYVAMTASTVLRTVMPHWRSLR